MTDRIKCSGCGATYERTYTRVSMRDKDRYECGLCGAVLESWDGSSIPSFRLVASPQSRDDTRDGE